LRTGVSTSTITISRSGGLRLHANRSGRDCRPCQVNSGAQLRAEEIRRTKRTSFLSGPRALPPHDWPFIDRAIALSEDHERHHGGGGVRCQSAQLDDSLTTPVIDLIGVLVHSTALSQLL
jgi:hypothetical protein